MNSDLRTISQDVFVWAEPMNFRSFKWKKESLPAVLLGAAVVFGVLILFKVTSLFEASARAQSLVRMAVARNELNGQGIKESTAACEAVAEELKKRNLFSPSPPPRHPVTSVLGILGSEVLIGDRWYKAGDTIGDAKIVAIEPTQVRIRWQGRETIFTPMEVAEGPEAGGMNSARRNFSQPEQDQTFAQEEKSPVSGERAERSYTAKSAKVPESDKTKAAAKQKSLAESKQYQKFLKQDIREPKKESAVTNKASDDTVARKKAAAAGGKSGRKSSR